MMADRGTKLFRANPKQRLKLSRSGGCCFFGSRVMPEGDDGAGKKDQCGEDIEGSMPPSPSTQQAGRAVCALSPNPLRRDAHASLSKFMHLRSGHGSAKCLKSSRKGIS